MLDNSPESNEVEFIYKIKHISTEIHALAITGGILFFVAICLSTRSNKTFILALFAFGMMILALLLYFWEQLLKTKITLTDKTMTIRYAWKFTKKIQLINVQSAYVTNYTVRTRYRHNIPRMKLIINLSEGRTLVLNDSAVYSTLSLLNIFDDGRLPDKDVTIYRVYEIIRHLTGFDQVAPKQTTQVKTLEDEINEQDLSNIKWHR